MHETVAAISSGSTPRLRLFLQSRLHPDMLERTPLERWVTGLAAMYDRTRGFEVDSMVVLGPHESVALLRSRLTGWHEWYAVRVEEQPPHRILALGRPSRPLAAPPRAAPQVSSDAERVRAARAFVDRIADVDVFSGVLLLARGDSILNVASWGDADKTRHVANRADTRFQMGSLTKPLTAVAVAQLAEQGRLAYDDPISKYFPAFRNGEALGTVRIKHLLAHTSGIQEHLRICERVQPCPHPARSLDDYVRQVELAQSDTLDFDAGSRWAYNNAGYVLLGKIVEIASGAPWSEYVTENVLRPAGMHGAGILEPGSDGEIPERLATGYEKEFAGGEARFRTEPAAGPGSDVGAGDAGAYATAEDVFRFVRAFFGGRLVRPETAKLMTSPKPEIGAPTWGYGFDLGASPGAVSHGATWAGASNSFDYWQDGGYTAVVLSNYSYGRILPREFIRLLFDPR